MKFTPSQRAAIERRGQDVCVIAGPGSGKTRVLTERFAWLVGQGVSPKSILAITFTEKAANEIRSRVLKRVAGEEIRQAPISTLHSFCLRTLKEFSIAAGLDPGVDLWDDRVAKAELYACVEEVLNAAAARELGALRALFTTWSVRDPSLELCRLYEKIWSLSDSIPAPEAAIDPAPALARLQDLGANIVAAPASTGKSQEFHTNFRAWFASFRAAVDWETLRQLQSLPKRGTLPKGLKEPAAAFYELAEQTENLLVSALTQEEKRFLLELLARIAERYAARKRAAARMDFKDVEHETIRLLERRPDIRTLLQNRYEHILMDEMQDTNPVQWRLLNLLRTPGGFYAVGDINQSIYRFRYAAPQLFRDYRAGLESVGAAVDRLRDNFRSRAEILAYTETVLAGEDGIEGPESRAGRRFQSSNAPVSIAGFEKQEDELAWLVAEIRTLGDSFIVEDKESGRLRHARLADIAVLVRTSSSGELVSAALSEAGIASTVSGGRDFFQQQEVIDLLNYLAHLANPLDTLAAAAVLRSPLVGLSDEDLSRGNRDAAFTEFYRAQRRDLDFVPPDILICRALDRGAYLATLAPAAQANVSKFLDILRKLWKEAPRTIRAFVDELTAMRIASDEKAATLTDSGDAVSILTVHAAKGLEFPVVFVFDAHREGSGRADSLNFHENHGVGVSWLNPLTGKRAADREYAAIAEVEKSEQAHENQRLLYVALTRAEQKVYISWASKQKRGWRKYLQDHPAPPYVERAVESVIDPVPAPPDFVEYTLGALPPLQPVTASATPTGLAQFAMCPRLFFLDHLCGLAQWPHPAEGAPPASDVPFADGNAKEFGAEVHEILAGIPRENRTAQALAEVFWRSELGQRAQRASRIEREFDFVYAEGELVIEGQIDLWFVEGGEAVVVDYKTDRSELRAPAYFTQLAVYKKVVAKLAPGLPLRAYLHFLRPDKIVEVTASLDPALLDRYVHATHYETAPGEHCQRCRHFNTACVP
jgi:ATP-dependent exoDNAse (exonuclease V) beta subunit